CGILGIDMGRTAAVGDAENDVPCFRTAGFSIAMGNSSDSVKSEADAVVPGCDSSGAAEALYRFVL
ncbi:MAG: HAD family hydrolase, partial [Oscillospiraceae bacterium]